MGCSGINTNDDIGIAVQKIMDSNQTEIDELKMKNSFLQLKLLNSFANQSLNFDNILQEYQSFILFQKDNNDNYTNITNNNSPQKCISLIFSINQTIYSINT